MAEFALAAILHFSRGFHWASDDRNRRELQHRRYRPILIEGKTVCVVGAGGIGTATADLCAGVGMRVVGTRRSATAQPMPAAFSQIAGPDDLDRLLAEADYTVIPCQSTPETTHLFNAARFAAMKPGSVFINVARGEIVDEEALADALARNHLRGVALDVYDGEFERPPRKDLWSDPRVLLTPHVSAGSDRSRTEPLELFCRNLRAFIEGRPLENMLDRTRGY